MPPRKLEVLLVNRSGPIKSMRLRPWLIRFLVILFFLMAAALAGGGYLLYQQHKNIISLSRAAAELRKQNGLLATQVHELKTMADLARQSAAAEQSASTTTITTTTTTTTEAPKTSTTATTQKSSEASRTTAAGEPAVSDEVAVRIVRQTITKARIDVVFDVVNKDQDEKPVAGYVTTIARGQRAGKPWIEASPAMRLSPLGRPLNFRRGEAFSVQRYRRFRAKFQVADKKIKRLEFLLYSRTGDLILVKMIDLDKLDKENSDDAPKRKPGETEG